MHNEWRTSSGLFRVSATNFEKATCKPSGTLGRFVRMTQIGMIADSSNTLYQLKTVITACKQGFSKRNQTSKDRTRYDTIQRCFVCLYMAVKVKTCPLVNK